MFNTELSALTRMYILNICYVNEMLFFIYLHMCMWMLWKKRRL